MTQLPVVHRTLAVPGIPCGLNTCLSCPGALCAARLHWLTLAPVSRVRTGALLFQVVTAYLMSSEQLAPQAALESLQAVHGRASPNDGFREQLELFHQMGCCLSPDHEAYRTFAMQQTGRRWHEEGHIDLQTLPQPAEHAAGQGPVSRQIIGWKLLRPVHLSGSPASQQGCIVAFLCCCCTGVSSACLALAQATLYRCRGCRRLVATGRNAVQLGPTQASPSRPFGSKNRSWERGSPVTPGADTSSLFVEPLQWMSAIIGQVQGKLYCPG